MTPSPSRRGKDVQKDPVLLAEIAGVINNATRVVVTAHVRPDGDAVGSVLGLGKAIKDSGRDVTIFLEDPVPDALEWLPGSHMATNRLEFPLGKGTLVVVLDCHEPRRIGRLGSQLLEEAAMVVVLDHHLGDRPICAMSEAPWAGRCLSYIDAGVFAAGALVYWLLQELDWPITPEIAMNLYTAVMTDTGCFRHGNTTAQALEMGASLVRHGADPYFAAGRIYQHVPIRRLKLLGLALKTLELRARGRVGLMQVTPEMFRVAGATSEDCQDFVSYARSVDSVEVAVMIKEVSPGQVAVSLRSKSYFDCAGLAAAFGGGGHYNAAGFRMAATASEVRTALLNRLEELLDGEDDD